MATPMRKVLFRARAVRGAPRGREGRKRRRAERGLCGPALAETTPPRRSSSLSTSDDWPLLATSEVRTFARSPARAGPPCAEERAHALAGLARRRDLRAGYGRGCALGGMRSPAIERGLREAPARCQGPFVGPAFVFPRPAKTQLFGPAHPAPVKRQIEPPLVPRVSI